jgi:hypothetical protein
LLNSFIHFRLINLHFTITIQRPEMGQRTKVHELSVIQICCRTLTCFSHWTTLRTERKESKTSGSLKTILLSNSVLLILLFVRNKTCFY